MDRYNNKADLIGIQVFEEMTALGLVTAVQIPLKWYADSDIAVSHSAPNGTIRCKMEATPLSYQTQIRTELSSPKPTRRCVAGFTARSDLLDRLCGVAS